MITTRDAFRKFRANLEPTRREREDASRRQKEIRAVMAHKFTIATDFLTGSYKRWTKTKPLKDVDIFCVLHDDERPEYRNDKPPTVLLDAVEEVLVEEYGRDSVFRQRRSIRVDFKVAGQPDKVMSFDVVPAFTLGDHYEIPDTRTASGWTATDPTVHADKATNANGEFSGEWKGMVRMAKQWNLESGHPVSPSFLIEVMAHDLLDPPFKGDYPYEFMFFFESLADRVEDEWADPAGLGPPVSDSMSPAERRRAKEALARAGEAVRSAIQLSRGGRNGEALRAYRDLFGPRFPLS